METKKKRSFEGLTLKRHSRGYVEILLYAEKGVIKPFGKGIDVLTSIHCGLALNDILKKYY
jgi:hypothetical protein